MHLWFTHSAVALCSPFNEQVGTVTQEWKSHKSRDSLAALTYEIVFSLQLYGGMVMIAPYVLRMAMLIPIVKPFKQKA
jgi:hypothetical protein